MSTQETVPEVPQTEVAPVQKTPSPKVLSPAPIPSVSPWKKTSTATAEAVPAKHWPSPHDAEVPAGEKKNFKNTGKEKWVPLKASVVIGNSNKKNKPKKKSPPAKGQPKKKNNTNKENKVPQPQAQSQVQQPKSHKFRSQDKKFTPKSKIPGFVPGKPFQPFQPFQQFHAPQQPVPVLYAVTTQMMYYFSIENLVKDIFLRKQMNSQGWVKFDTVAGFKRLVTLSEGDVNVILASISSLIGGDIVEAGYVGETLKLRAKDWEKWVFSKEEGRVEEDESVPEALLDAYYFMKFVPVPVEPEQDA